MILVAGVILVTLAGLSMGSLGWPIKSMRTFEYEHFWFIAMLLGLFVVPWTVTLTMCPDAIGAYLSLDRSVLIKSNLFALGWGIANILWVKSMVRIGSALTLAIMTGLGVAVGVTVPMIFKGTGLFSASPDIGSPAANMVLIGVGIIVIGVIVVSLAGFGRDRVLAKTEQQSGGFLGGLIMCIISGILSAGIALSFVYSQGPIVAAMKERGAGDVPAILSVWAVGLFSGMLVNIIYPAVVITRKKTWWKFRKGGGDYLLAAIMGAHFIVAVMLMGWGMLTLGVLGASVGFGIQQSMQIMGGQIVGFLTGEWKGVTGKPRLQMYIALGILVIAMIILAFSNTLAKG